MRILSFDVGIKNLSYCILEQNENVTNISSWNNICITNENIKHVKLESLTENVLQCLIDNFNEQCDVDIVLIENQPSLKNGLMKTISVIIYTYFNLLKIQFGLIESVQFISACNKLKCKKSPSSKVKSYKERKALSIALTKQYLEEICPGKIEWFNEQKKCDDLADAFLAAIHHLGM
jgi:hypothetical protein